MSIIGLAGYAQSGKDTLGDRLVKYHGYTKVGFADGLRALMVEVNPIVLWGTTWLPWNDVVDLIGYERAKRETNGREVMQRMGNGVRNVLGKDSWVNAATWWLLDGSDYVFTDVRFPNEVEAINRLGGKVYRIVRPGTRPVNGHVSETAIDHFQFDGYINNNTTVEDFFAAAEQVLGFGVSVGD